MKKYFVTTLIAISLFSCSENNNLLSNRVYLGSSSIDQSSVIDTNHDAIPDIERWYRGSQIAFEKIDLDYDGYWDVQGRRHSDGSFDTYIRYPKRKYSVYGHHVFYANSDHPVDVKIIARAAQ